MYNLLSNWDNMSMVKTNDEISKKIIAYFRRKIPQKRNELVRAIFENIDFFTKKQLLFPHNEITCINIIKGLDDEFPDQAADESSPLTSIPEKSKDLYEKEYRVFSSWCVTNHHEKITENVMLLYFKEKSKTWKSSTLYTKYCILKPMLAMMNDIDITKFKHVLKFLKEIRQGYVAVKKSETLTREQMNMFIRDAPDDVYLMMKVALIFGVAGAMRCVELCSVTLDDIEDSGSTITFTIKDPHSPLPRVARILDEGEDLNFAYYYRKYAALRPSHTPHRRFFLGYRDGKCSIQVVGQNTFGKIPLAVAKFLKIPNANLYTGHCFKSTCKLLRTGMTKQTSNTLSSLYGLRH